MVQGIWRELGPLIVLAHLPEILCLLLVLLVTLGGLVGAVYWWLIEGRGER